MRYEDENIWLTQKMMAELYNVTIPAINQHIKKIYEDNELDESSTIKKYLIVQNEGKDIITLQLQIGRKFNNIIANLEKKCIFKIH